MSAILQYALYRVKTTCCVAFPFGGKHTSRHSGNLWKKYLMGKCDGTIDVCFLQTSEGIVFGVLDGLQFYFNTLSMSQVGRCDTDGILKDRSHVATAIWWPLGVAVVSVTCMRVRWISHTWSEILNNMGPGYLSSLFEKSNVPYQLRDNDKLVQPLKRTTTFGIKYFAYFGAHLWNLLPHHIKESVSLYNFKSLERNGRVLHALVVSVL